MRLPDPSNPYVVTPILTAFGFGAGTAVAGLRVGVFAGCVVGAIVFVGALVYADREGRARRNTIRATFALAMSALSGAVGCAMNGLASFSQAIVALALIVFAGWALRAGMSMVRKDSANPATDAPSATIEHTIASKAVTREKSVSVASTRGHVTAAERRKQHKRERRERRNLRRKQRHQRH